MRLLALLVLAGPALAQTPLSCADAGAVKCVRAGGGDFRCAPGVYEPLPFGRPVEERPSDATVTPEGGQAIRLTELVFDTSGLSRLDQQYVMNEFHRRKSGGRRSEFTTTNKRSGEVTREVSIPGIAVRRFRAWVKAGCQPPGQFLRYEPKGRSAAGTTYVSPRDRQFRDRLLGGAKPSKWTAGGEMDRRSREIWKGRARRSRDER